MVCDAQPRQLEDTRALGTGHTAAESEGPSRMRCSKTRISLTQMHLHCRHFTLHVPTASFQEGPWQRRHTDAA